MTNGAANPEVQGPGAGSGTLSHNTIYGLSTPPRKYRTIKKRTREPYFRLMTKIKYEYNIKFSDRVQHRREVLVVYWIWLDV